MAVDVSPSVYKILGAVMSITTICSFIFNGCGLVVFCRNKALRSPTNIFIMALCVCDILMAVPASIATASCFYHGFAFSHSMCMFEGFMSYFLGLTSMYLLAAIGVDRYIIITKPLHSSKITTRVAIFSVAGCLFLGFVWSAPPLFGWNRYALEGLGLSCSVVWHTDYVSDISYIITIFIFCLVLPVAIMVFSYLHVYMTIRHISLNSTWEKTSRIGQKNVQMEKRMFFTCIALVSAFLISWTPYTVVSFMSAFGRSHLVTPLSATVPALIAKLSGIWNPIIYIITNKQFRVAFYKMMPCSLLQSKLVNMEGRRNERASQSETLRYSKTSKILSTVGERSGISVLPGSRSLQLSRSTKSEFTTPVTPFEPIPENDVSAPQDTNVAENNHDKTSTSVATSNVATTSNGAIATLDANVSVQ